MASAIHKRRGGASIPALASATKITSSQQANGSGGGGIALAVGIDDDQSRPNNKKGGRRGRFQHGRGTAATTLACCALLVTGCLLVIDVGRNAAVPSSSSSAPHSSSSPFSSSFGGGGGVRSAVRTSHQVRIGSDATINSGTTPTIESPERPAASGGIMRRTREQEGRRGGGDTTKPVESKPALTTAAVAANDALRVVVSSAPQQPFLVRQSSAPNSSTNSSSVSRTSPSISLGGRFPKYGTEEFTRLCSWTLGGSPQSSVEKAATTAATTAAAAPPPLQHRNCTLYFSPNRNTEGLSSWLGILVQYHMSARQIGCRIMFDYGSYLDVKLDEVVMPFQNSGVDGGGGGQRDNSAHHNNPLNNLNDWTVPPNFSCTEAENCFRMPFRNIGKMDGAPMRLAPVPIYRRAYNGNEQHRLIRSKYQKLQQTLGPSFDLERGLACSHGSLFTLSPTANMFEPNLYTTLLPQLEDEGALVMALYVRTGWADVVADRERAGQEAGESRKHIGAAQRHINCALHLEGQYLSAEGELELQGESRRRKRRSFTHIVWLVVSDSPGLKEAVVEAYDGHKQQHDANKANSTSISIPRHVLVTSSAGTHTRTTRSVSTADFANAFLDWYLLGESDLVIADVGGYTYGAMGAMRTARPLYDVKSGSPCERKVLVDER